MKPLLALALACLLSLTSAAQTLQKGIDANARGASKLSVDYVGYRAAKFETQNVIEPQHDRPNVGGITCVYLTNNSGKPAHLAFWRLNGKDESYWRMDGPLAWDRTYNENLQPGESTVCEINGVTEDLGPGKPFKFSYIDRESWVPVCRCDAVLNEDAIQISLIRVLPGLGNLEIHMRNTGKDDADLQSVSVAGHAVSKTEWVGQKLSGGANAIARVKLEKPLAPAGLIIAKVAIKDHAGGRAVFCHRRAFEDYFPIGVWSNNERTWPLLHKLHIDTMVAGGSANNEFFAKAAPTYGFRAIVGVGKPIDVDQIRSLGDLPATAGWMLDDEPDWTTPPIVMLYMDQFVRGYNKTKPTFITLCRNVKFFEFAAISDIPCMDHYCVTAPTSSKWPHPYGTRLEETGYYTRDLKAASEPKPIWVWSQGIAEWGERPKRPVPTPNELAAQLMLNLANGAKGILWFNYDEGKGDKFSDTRDAMMRWGRVMQVTRADFLGSEPYQAGVRAPDKLDVATLATWDKVLICVTNKDYEIDPQAYPFKTQKDVKLKLKLPSWISPKSAMSIGPDGVNPIQYKAKGEKATLEIGDIEACKLIVLANDPNALQTCQAAYAKCIEDEK